MLTEVGTNATKSRSEGHEYYLVFKAEFHFGFVFLWASLLINSVVPSIWLVHFNINQENLPLSPFRPFHKSVAITLVCVQLVTKYDFLRDMDGSRDKLLADRCNLQIINDLSKGERMRKFTCKLIALAMTLMVGCSSEERQEVATQSGNATQREIVCDKFELVTKVTGSTLEFAVDTDLPDNAVVMVGVSRSYFEKGCPDSYLVDYFSEKSTVGKWKSKHSVSIASSVWKANLRAKQEEMSKLGLGFDVASVSDSFEVSMVVPINQPDPKFGQWNRNLRGEAVTIKGIRVVKNKIEIHRPLNASLLGKPPFPNLHPMELEIGTACVVSKETPLTPFHSPANPMAAIKEIIQIPKSGGFRVIEVYKKKNTPWYRVIAFDQTWKETEAIGVGWISSTALLGQKLVMPLKSRNTKVQKRTPDSSLSNAGGRTPETKAKIAAVTELNRELVSSLEKALDRVVKSKTAVSKQIQNAIKKGDSLLSKAARRITSIQAKKNDFLLRIRSKEFLSSRLRKSGDLQESIRFFEASQSAAYKARDLISGTTKNKDFDAAADVLELRLSLAQLGLSAAYASGNAGAKARSSTQVCTALNDQINLEKQRSELLQRCLVITKARALDDSVQTARLNSLVVDIKKEFSNLNKDGGILNYEQLAEKEKRVAVLLGKLSEVGKATDALSASGGITVKQPYVREPKMISNPYFSDKK